MRTSVRSQLQRFHLRIPDYNLNDSPSLTISSSSEDQPEFSILEAWKSEQAANLAAMPARLELKIEQAKHQQAHDILASEKEQTHRQWMEANIHSHDSTGED